MVRHAWRPPMLNAIMSYGYQSLTNLTISSDGRAGQEGPTSARTAGKAA